LISWESFDDVAALGAFYKAALVVLLPDIVITTNPACPHFRLRHSFMRRMTPAAFID
jgi:hypothetical protein